MIDHLADLESDFSRFHRIDDIYTLDGPRFMRLAWRVSTYGGVMALRLEEQQLSAPSAAPAARRAIAPRPARGGGAKSVAAAAMELPDVFDVRRAS